MPAEMLLMEEKRCGRGKGMSKKKKNGEPKMNYLDLIPLQSPEIRWHRDFQERVILDVENRGVFHTIAQKVFQKPRFTKVHLDGRGSFIWPLIDGKKTVEEIGGLVKMKFGEDAEPLYPRLVKYFRMMESYHFISFLNMQNK